MFYLIVTACLNAGIACNDARLGPYTYGDCTANAQAHIARWRDEDAIPRSVKIAKFRCVPMSQRGIKA